MSVGMSLKLECHSNWSATKIEIPLKLYVTQIKISLNLEFHLHWNVTQNGMSLKLKCHSRWNVTQIGMSLKVDVKQIEKTDGLKML